MTETRPSEAVMPYSSEEYESGDWTVDSLVEHFKSIGFRNIKTNVEDTIYREKEGIEKLKLKYTLPIHGLPSTEELQKVIHMKPTVKFTSRPQFLFQRLRLIIMKNLLMSYLQTRITHMML